MKFFTQCLCENFFSIWKFHMGFWHFHKEIWRKIIIFWAKKRNFAEILPKLGAFGGIRAEGEFLGILGGRRTRSRSRANTTDRSVREILAGSYRA